MREIHTDLTIAQIAQRTLRLLGEPYSLRDYPMFVDIYNSLATRRVMRAGRQVSKTVTIAGDMVINTAMNPYTSVIYCNSSQMQTHSFSTAKLAPFLQQSPIIYKSLCCGKNNVDNVLTKELSNRSSIKMSYFSEDSDRLRGMSGHRMYLDEVQDMLWSAMIDAEECLSAAPEPRFTYAGTSKSTITPLEFLWSKSTQRSWVIRCDGCGKWNIPGRENIGKHGIICKKCGHPLNTYEGRWHALNPSKDGAVPFAEGYWVPQIIMPLHCCHEDKWRRLLEKLETYPDMKFDNEVLGIPSGEGESFVTEEMLKKNCVDSLAMVNSIDKCRLSGTEYVVAGIDWGGGGLSGVSRTVLSIYAVSTIGPTYTKIYGKIFDEGEPVNHVKEIGDALKRFRVHMCFGDHGGGNFAMSQLKGCVPASIRIVPVMYSAASKPLSWDEGGQRYIVNRTLMIDNFFADWVAGKIRAFRWSEFEPFARDILNIRQEIIGEDRGGGKRVWRHAPDKPDDSLHSMVFGWLAARVITSRMNFTV